MSAKIYLSLLFFCGILCLEIVATLADKDISLSSNLLERKRRVINHLPEGRVSPRIESVYYIIRIKEASQFVCAGAILSHYTVITAATCVLEDNSKYKIYSGAAGNIGYNMHNITSKSVHNGNPPHHYFDGIALITVDPPFEFNRKTGHIELYEGPLPAGTITTVFGWGFVYPLRPGTEMRKRLRKITLPIITHVECRADYAGRFNITEKHICTIHDQQYCAHDDSGAPLLVNDRLAGIHIWKGEFRNQRNPDVFINLQRPEYSEWIRENSLLM